MAAVLVEKSDTEATHATFFQRLTAFLQNSGVETHGIAPVPNEKRVDTRTYQLFTIWFSASTNISGVVIGAAGPVVFHLSFLTTAIIALVANAVATFGPKLGARSMVQARFSWGVYGVAIPSFLTVLSTMVYMFLNTVVGGQLLASISNHLTPDVGIVVIALICLVITFCGYRVLHWFEAVAWILTILGICVMLGAGGSHLTYGPSYPTPTPASVLSFAATILANQISWANMIADYGVYHDANTSSARIFTYTYLGIFLPGSAPLFAAAVPSVPSWAAGYNGGNDLGGLVSAVLEPVGRFGKFLVVLLVLGISASNAPLMYSFGISLMNVSTIFAKVPRYVYAVFATGVVIPLAVFGQTRFYNVIIVGVNLVGYWAASFAGIVFIEHVVFRHCNFANYNMEDWDQPQRLLPGLAALVSFFGSFGLIVPCMAQTFYVGPIARTTGDIGIPVGFNSGVETHGIAPVPREKRVDARTYQLFTIWLSASTNISGIVIGAAGPVVFHLSFWNTTIIALIASVVATFGPKLGARSMVQARFSWGVYGVGIPSFLNVLSTMVYMFLNTLIGGQLLARVSNHLTPDVGIVVIALICLVISFCGYRALHWFEAIAWITTAIGISVMLGVGGPHLTSGPPYPMPTLASILSFAATILAGQIGWASMIADYGVYHDANTSRIFTYTYLGIFLPGVILQLVGTAFAATAPSVPSWAAGYDGGNDLGGLVSAVLEPVGGFGKFLVVLMVLGISASNAPLMYSFGISLMNVSTIFAKVPRYVYAVVATGISIPLAIFGQTRFYNVIIAGVDLVGYWSASFAGIVFIEHVVFRHCNFANYNMEDWDQPQKLLPGLAALVSFFGSSGLIVPCMAQTFYVGPIARTTGDIGIPVGFVSACILYWVLRPLEARLFPGRSS
ncbi:Cytosine-purine permease [Mycena sanguinolenta]|uniref:Cytosine-purine permease n=1 Tax=Mycena sanguinolenta TaxID=230812 RepID=A0A8H6XDZ1_9AGAR|nr:Cytosine-purine permease [Mycena sanguinolenta]